MSTTKSKKIAPTKTIVINRCHGGFNLSHAAVVEYAKRKKLNLTFKKNKYGDCKDYKVNGKFWYPEWKLKRDDKNLVAVVKKLGTEKASGTYSMLQLVEIPADVEWFIEEYDGMEWVAEKHRTWN